jgi:chemotaxis protein MotA
MADNARPGSSSDSGQPKPPGGKPDLASIAGLAIALLGIVGGLTLEGGNLKDIAQLTAALIVLGGTAGAVLVSTPGHVVKGALRRLVGVFAGSSPPLGDLIDEVIGYSAKARKNGLVSLEQEADRVADPFLRRALNLAVDGTDLQDIRKMLDIEIEMDEHYAEAEVKVFELAGGYSPTIGIIGAVLGLIQVMKNLTNIEGVGHGIAVAFVATVYGVASANLLFLPAAAKMKAKVAAEALRKELIIEAVSGIVEGLNPKLVRMKLEVYARKDARKAKAQHHERRAPERDRVEA